MNIVPRTPPRPTRLPVPNAPERLLNNIYSMSINLYDHETLNQIIDFAKMNHLIYSININLKNPLIFEIQSKMGLSDMNSWVGELNSYFNHHLNGNFATLN